MPFSSHLNHAHRHRGRALARLRPINIGVAALAGAATIGVAGALAATHPADTGASDPVADVGTTLDDASAPALAASPDPATTPRAGTSPSSNQPSHEAQSSHQAQPSTKAQSGTKPAAKPSVRTSTPRRATVSGGTKKPVAKSAGS